MKARIQYKHLVPSAYKDAIQELAKEEVSRYLADMQRKESDFFILSSACALHTTFGFGKIRLERYMSALQEFYEYLGGFDDCAKEKCIQILKRAGVNISDTVGDLQ